MIHSAVPGRYCGILVAIASILVGLSDFACAFSGAPLLPFASSGSRLGRSSTVAVFSSTLDLGTEAVEAASAGALAASKDRAVTLLDSALKRDEAAATTIIEEIQLLRSTGGDADRFLDGILSVVDTSRLPIWTRIRPLAYFSRRARRAAMRRVLDLSAPEVEGEVDVDEAEKRNRRRSFSVLLRTLAETEETGASRRKSSIIAIERYARREARDEASAQDMVNRLPGGLETPKYSVLATRSKRKGGYEIRRYEPYSMCTVQMTKPRPADSAKTDAKISNPQLSGASSFGALAGYLFGKNSDSKAMKMTTPVLTVGDEEIDKAMSFILPSDYWAEGADSQAPKPLDGSGVQIERDEGGTRAAIMFGGDSSKAVVERKKAQLLEGLEKDDEYEIADGGLVILAQYNDPFTPPWKRRNEVAVSVAARAKE